MYRTQFENKPQNNETKVRTWERKRHRSGRKYGRTPDGTQTPTINMVSVGCGIIHRDRNNYVEEAGKYMYIGRRDEMDYGYYRYEIAVKIENSTLDDQGMYVCSVERKHDRLYTSTWVSHGELNVKPLVEIVSCDSQHLDTFPFTLYLTRGRPTCLRCRGIGFPVPTLSMRKGKNVLQENRSLSFDDHMNVADGGIAEITYTFWNPTSKDAGEYTCFALNKDNYEASATFWIEVDY